MQQELPKNLTRPVTLWGEPLAWVWAFYQVSIVQSLLLLTRPRLFNEAALIYTKKLWTQTKTDLQNRLFFNRGLTSTLCDTIWNISPPSLEEIRRQWELDLGEEVSEGRAQI